MNERLHEQYISVCRTYAQMLVSVLGASASEVRWQDGRVGGILIVRDALSFTMPEIVEIVDGELTAEQAYTMAGSPSSSDR